MSFIKITDPDAVQTHESAIFVQPKKLSNNSDSSNPTLSDASTVPPGGDLPSISTNPNLQEKRRVSIVSDPVGDARLGYDNLGFEPNSRRKISQASIHSHSEIGPTRRKSILVNSTPAPDAESIHSHLSTTSCDPRLNGKPLNGGLTALESVYDKLQKTTNSQANSNANLEQSWIYMLCMRCRVEYNTPSWEPPYWQTICPYPLCPSYRQFARIISLFLIGILIWISAYIIIGDSAAPGGQLFGLVVLTVVAHFGGWIVSLTTLPRLIGMLFVGILFQNVGWVDLGGDFSEVTAQLRKFALAIILIRAGLEMEAEAFRKVYKTILKLGIVPWIVEAAVITVLSHFLLGLPVIWGSMLGAIIAAVSPAVVVPCLFRLRTKGYGVAKGIPTLIVAVTGIDDAMSVALFGIISSIVFSADNLAYQISQAPVCIIGGLAFGVVWGYLAQFVPESGDSYVVPLRTIMLFSGGLMAIYGSEKIGFEGAGPLGVVFAAFVSNLFWIKQGWDVEDNPVSTAFEIFWMIFEPILFGITGATIKFNELDPDLVSVGIGCIAAGVVIRVFVTAGIAFGDHLNRKEKIFAALSWMSKATVQAALGPAALRHLGPNASEEEKRYGTIIQTVAVLSIICTAPLGAIVISLTGTRLLTKTKEIVNVEGWRRSHRPSLRDISIIDEEEEREDPEIAPDKTTLENTNSNQHINIPSYSHIK
ncbi:unnamed protein product [Hermetia illucens]|uniref:Cation/H+ exchanger transmembrane domain-containing protein n=1 Tax=Hermetia illucens TaxID=343691 RepID=A0A7R8USP1_HERIL|nr:sodium/hydrogen exchanger 9B2 isoform X2 [Hermetia illucens]CAD7085885.1 unnamed protein product [Hermetia illucens]